MQHSEFQVKISDMLQSKVTDTLSFENKMLKEVPNLTQDGVSGQVTLQSLGKDAIFVTIDELSCSVTEICDRCGAEYERDLQIFDYTAKYVLDLNEDEQKEEEVLPIDAKNGVIDLWELVYHAIKMQEPFVKYCPECETQVGERSEEEMELDEY